MRIVRLLWEIQVVPYRPNYSKPFSQICFMYHPYHYHYISSLKCGRGVW